MTILSVMYSLTINILTFWMPAIYTFKFLMEKETTKIPVILKFWCMISVYSLVSLLLEQILDESLFPIINLVCLIALNYPPYEMTEKMYNSTLGEIYKQNKESFKKIEDKIVQIFDKNSQTLKSTIQDKTNKKLKGFMGDIVKATIAGNYDNKQQKNSKKKDDSDEDD